jgi:Flp pilus assembly protein TadD
VAPATAVSGPEQPASEAAAPAAGPAAHALTAKLAAHHHKGTSTSTSTAMSTSGAASPAEPGLDPAAAKPNAGAAAAGPATPASALDPAAAEAPPAQRGAREVMSEGERLLGQGEVRDACARGEEAKRMSPKMAPIYKFLGKCYMRAGNTAQANDNYKKYLDLSPNASDAMFIKSIIK